MVSLVIRTDLDFFWEFLKLLHFTRTLLIGHITNHIQHAANILSRDHSLSITNYYFFSVKKSIVKKPFNHPKLQSCDIEKKISGKIFYSEILKLYLLILVQKVFLYSYSLFCFLYKPFIELLIMIITISRSILITKITETEK